MPRDEQGCPQPARLAARGVKITRVTVRFTFTANSGRFMRLPLAEERSHECVRGSFLPALIGWDGSGWRDRRRNCITGARGWNTDEGDAEPREALTNSGDRDSRKSRFASLSRNGRGGNGCVDGRGLRRRRRWMVYGG